MIPAPKVKNEAKRAPVLISVYDRRQHLEMCIDALLQNPEAKETTLYIVSDGAKDASTEPAIKEVRDYIRSITGFKELKPRFREENWGMRPSAMEAMEWVLSENECFIRMEDDIICSPHYLRYMNEALNIYEDDDRIFCICAHTHPKFYPPRHYTHDVFLWRSFSGWGFATWKDRWEEFLESTENEQKQLADPLTWKAYCKNRPVLGSRETYLKGMLHNDARINLHLFLAGLYAVFPTENLTINTGMDGFGTHCGLGWMYPRQQLSTHAPRITSGLTPSTEIAKQLYRCHYSLINHGIGGVLRAVGCFDTLNNLYQQLIHARYQKK